MTLLVLVTFLIVVDVIVVVVFVLAVVNSVGGAVVVMSEMSNRGGGEDEDVEDVDVQGVVAGRAVLASVGLVVAFVRFLVVVTRKKHSHASLFDLLMYVQY